MSKDPLTRTPARARQLASGVTRTQGIEACLQLMTQGAWSSRACRDMAARHGVAVSTVGDWAAEASRIVRRVVSGDHETIRTAVVAGIEAIGALALERAQDPEEGRERVRYLEVALKSYVERARVIGLTAPDPAIQINVLASLSDAQLAARYRELTGHEWVPPEPLLPDIVVEPEDDVDA